MEGKYKILIVDDDRVLLKSLSQILEKNGYKVEIATTGQETIKKTQESWFNLVLLDISLPDKDGLELMKLLNESSQATDVIIITANTNIEFAIRALNMGATAYILKPLKIDHLLETIKNTLDKQQLILDKQLTEKKLKESEAKFRTITEQLKQSEEKYRSLFENMTAGFAYHEVIVDENNKPIDYKYIEANPAFEKLTGIGIDELIGKTVTEVLPGTETDPADWIGNFGNVGLTGIPLTVEDYSEQLDRWYYVSGYSPKKGYFAVTFTDITDRKKAEEKLKESEEKYRLIVENAHEGIWAIDGDAYTTFVNNRMAEILGYSIDEMLGKHLYSFMDEDGVKIAEINLKRRQMGIKEHHDFEFLRKDGTKIFTRLETSPILDEKGEYRGAMAFIIDITERRIAEKKIANLARFPSENPYPVLRVNQNIVIYTNHSGQKLFNIKDGSNVPKILKVNVNEVLESKILKELELEINNRIYSLIITPVEDEIYVNIYGIDITERKRAEKSLHSFVTTLSHELRTPLTVLSMSESYLDQHKGKLSTEVEEKLRQGISRNIALLSDLVEDILTLSKVDERKIKLDLIEYRPSDIIDEIQILLEPMGRTKNITFEVDVSNDILLIGDVKRIDQIFRILIDNCIKYSTNNNKIEIKAIDNYIGNKSSKSGVLFQFKDYGIGISEDDLPHLFERFFRSEQVSNISGTGLGLAIAKELVEFHEGEIYVESELGKGSIFAVFLPRIKTQL